MTISFAVFVLKRPSILQKRPISNIFKRLNDSMSFVYNVLIILKYNLKFFLKICIIDSNIN